MKASSLSPHIHGPVSALDLGRKTWASFEKLFSANRGVWGGCWCMFYHVSEGFDTEDYDGNRTAKRSLVNGGKAHGTIVFCGGDPVGWCQFGPREELPRIDRKKLYRPTSKDAWRLTCLFVDRRHRHLGIARAAVREAVASMKNLGVKSVEAYPVEGKLSSSLLWSGTPELFKEAGFRKVGPLGKNSWVFALSLR